MKQLKFKNTRFLLIFVLILLLSACNKVSNNSKLEDLLIQNKITNINNVKKIFILSSNDCLNCNVSLSNSLESFIDDKFSVIIITADETRMDLSKFKSHFNIIFVNENDHKDFQLLKKSQIIYLKNGNIERIITINAKDLKNQLESLI